jgi:putative tryptophan/tyrosine transport system substrate-binding protein
VKRRQLLGALCAGPFIHATIAQPRSVLTIGVLTLGVDTGSPHLEALRQGLREHGYIDGKNVRFEYRFADGHADRLAPMAAELLKRKVDLIVTESVLAAIAASKATKTIPIVMAVATNPLSAGLAASLARPGGNVTGLTLAGAERTAKQIQMLKESLPAATSMAVLYAPRADIEADLAEATSSGRSLALALQLFELTSPQDFEKTFDAVTRARPSAVISIGHGMLLGNRRRIIDFCLKAKLPGVFPTREFADDGGLMSYGPDLATNFRRVGAYVDRIVKGARPGDLPIEQPTKWELVVNLRTAQALGIKIPGTVLVRADTVIQ